jgi:type VI secretion system protein ImpK
MNETPHALSGDEQAAAGFRAFVAEVQDILRSLPGSAANPALNDANESALAAHRRLRTVIDMQGLQASQQGGRATAAQLDQERYLKAALADELLLSRPWAGQAAWPQHLLETALFGTSVAGDKLLDDMALLLQAREAGQRPLGHLYLSALALGFQGRLRGQDDLRALGALGLQLYQFVYQRLPPVEPGQSVLSPQAYAHTVSQPVKRRRSFSRWTLQWVASLAVLLVVSQALWLWQTWPLRQALTGTGAGLQVKSTGVAR